MPPPSFSSVVMAQLTSHSSSVALCMSMLASSKLAKTAPPQFTVMLSPPSLCQAHHYNLRPLAAPLSIAATHVATINHPIVLPNPHHNPQGPKASRFLPFYPMSTDYV
ncbi:hypothetical protein EUGRSUZ_E02683 [Eucalyptus grandis]|uniref:Uncharacterized protein n=2 Tax=Eucalyptus grandis TaxID=71139 RepID=A0ACC3KYE5_EUCGR|nr:hypothetical protein EUGRSUZ_E02683 [Eucalyptus grandis]